MNLFASANRDPLQFPLPNRFDIGRSPNVHYALGRKVYRHVCPSRQSLTPMLGEAVLTALLDQVKSLRAPEGIENLPWTVQPQRMPTRLIVELEGY